MGSSSSRSHASSSETPADSDTITARWKEALSASRAALTVLEARAEAANDDDQALPDVDGIAELHRDAPELAGIIAELDKAVDACFAAFHASHAPLAQGAPRRPLRKLFRREPRVVEGVSAPALLVRFNRFINALSDHRQSLQALHADYEAALVACHTRRQADTAPLRALGTDATPLSTRQIDDMAKRDTVLLKTITALDAIFDVISTNLAELALAHRKTAVDAERLLLLWHVKGHDGIDETSLPALAPLVAHGMPDANDVERRRQAANSAFAARFSTPVSAPATAADDTAKPVPV
jgi:hypothetical protein